MLQQQVSNDQSRAEDDLSRNLKRQQMIRKRSKRGWCYSKTVTEPDNPTSSTSELFNEESATSTATETVPYAATDEPAGVQLASTLKLEQINVAIKGGSRWRKTTRRCLKLVICTMHVIDSDGLTKTRDCCSE